jgi:nicotinate-nucleotide--dimethylbenzimidazole phosphoribosyltransferase
MLTCAKLHIPFVIDGFITAVAYACAARIDGCIEKYAIPSHMSREPGMAYSLLLGNILADDVMLRGDMALGEGTGAILMVCLLKTMIFTLNNMASYAEMLSPKTSPNEALSMKEL